MAGIETQKEWGKAEIYDATIVSVSREPIKIDKLEVSDSEWTDIDKHPDFNPDGNFSVSFEIKGESARKITLYMARKDAEYIQKRLTPNAIWLYTNGGRFPRKFKKELRKSIAKSYAKVYGMTIWEFLSMMKFRKEWRKCAINVWDDKLFGNKKIKR